MPTSLQPLSLGLSPTGHLLLYTDPDNEESISAPLADSIKALFAKDAAVGLLHFGLSHFNTPLPASLAFWHQFARLFVNDMGKMAQSMEKVEPKLADFSLPESVANRLLAQAPFMRGVEHLNYVVMNTLWQDLAQALLSELAPFDGQLTAYLESHHIAWSKLGRVCFHLAENKTDTQRPFAFLATYTTGLSNSATVQHLPLGRALQEYAGDGKRTQLLTLLLPVQKAAEQCDFIQQMVDKGSLFQPLAWNASQAYQFLQTIPKMEAAGITVRVPNWWNPKQPPRPQISIAVGNQPTSTVGLNALLDFDMQFALPDGEQLTAAELQNLLNSQSQLVQVKGQWVEVDSAKLTQVLTHWQQVTRRVKRDGLSFSEGLRILAGAPGQQADTMPMEEVAKWSKVSEGNWLHETLSHLRQPEQAEHQALDCILQQYMPAQLRTYQQTGMHWLWWLYQLKLGGCLADDMGLGKTIQVLALLLLVKHQPELKSSLSTPHLLVVPASLLGNWQAEIQRFAPSLAVWVAHSSSIQQSSQPQTMPDLSKIDLVITTYGYVQRLAWLLQTSWDMVILDEAQSIKNPSTKQTRAIKALVSQVRFILTGTPIENRLLDLWSLFDFIAPGLLGSSRVFSDYGKQAVKRAAGSERQFYAAVRHLVSPYILRRLKSDKRIIADLPDKTELDTYCVLTKQQVGLYQKALAELTQKLAQGTEDGIARRGLVLAYLLRFKQICNHPSQWLGHGQYDEHASGKFSRLRELCEVIAAKQEKVLVFTQFREIIPALCEFLSSVFKQPGLALHGGTAIRQRAKLVSAFQDEQGPPFFVLSLKAGGTGLNLTNAAHVVHFDRWWNPAVENQATDRAYRIGQKKNVLVHKFICRGTIEEKIAELIGSKKSLAEDVLSSGSETLLTELSDSELLNIVALDIHRALGE